MIQENEDTIIKELMSTRRSGMMNLIVRMTVDGFFTAPCSTEHHLNTEGGLAEHSLNVYRIALKLNETLEADIPIKSIIISSLLHDLGKMGDYGKPEYVPNILKSGKEAAKPYKTNPDLLYIDHALRSVKIASKYIDLTEQEDFAITYHNGLYTGIGYDVKKHETPLYLILTTADMWASRVIEKKGGDE